MQVIFNDVRNSVIQALEEAFPNIPVSGEEINPLPDPPRFFVRLLEPTHTKELGQRYRREHPMVVQYFAVGGNNADMYDMAEQLTGVLKQITLGDYKKTGRAMRVQIIDDVLHVYVTYSFIVWEPSPDVPTMQTLSQEGNVIET